MKRVLLTATVLIVAAGSAAAQTPQGRRSGNTGQAGTDLSTGGVTVPLPRVEIIPTSGGFVGALIESPPPALVQDRPGISGLTAGTLRRDLNGEGQGAGGANSGSGSGGGASRGGSAGGGGSDAGSGLDSRAGAIDEQRGAVQQQLRNTSGAGVTASEGLRPNRVAGDRLDARQNRLGSDATGSVSGSSSLGGQPGGTSSGLGGGSLGGAGRSSGAGSGTGGVGGGSGSGGAGGGAGGGGGR